MTPLDRLAAALEPLPFPHETQRTTVRTDDLALVLAVVEAAREAADTLDAYRDPQNQYTSPRWEAVGRTQAALRAALAAITEGAKP